MLGIYVAQRHSLSVKLPCVDFMYIPIAYGPVVNQGGWPRFSGSEAGGVRYLVVIPGSPQLISRRVLHPQKDDPLISLKNTGSPPPKKKPEVLTPPLPAGPVYHFKYTPLFSIPPGHLNLGSNDRGYNEPSFKVPPGVT